MMLSATLSSIHQCCDRLRQLATHDLIDTWHIQFDDTTTPANIGDRGSAVELDDRRYALWPQGRITAWFTTAITIPEMLHGYAIAGKTLRLALRWWAEDAQIFVNGDRVLTGDLYDCFGRVVVARSTTPGATINLAIRLVSPGHDDGALVTSVLHYESEYTPDGLDPGFVADEIAVVVARLSPEEQTTERTLDIDDRLHHVATLLEPLHQWLESTEPQDIQSFTAAINHQLHQLHHQLATDFPRDRLAINLLTHAHLDMAWLWPLSETYTVAQRTFESVLNLQNAYPEMIYTHSSPALYAWIEHHRPDLFAQIQAQVRCDRWDLAAGMWVEPELNIISGESIVRQILHGQRYYHDKFGQISRVVWLPDSFGFCWQLPQLLTQGGIDYFVTQKLRWNDTTRFPHDLFRWQAPDGTLVVAWMSPPIGTDITPVDMTRYAAQWQHATGRNTALWLPGAGDHGGGPTRDMLDRVQRWQNSPVFPAMQFQTSVDFLDTVTRNTDDLPVWSSELYLELHRGCYTTYASQKRANRTCEILLYQAELYATIAALYADYDYPATELDTAWKRVLLNQFHDILPGSAIPEVFADANREWAAAQSAARSVREAALQMIVTTLTPLPSADNEPLFSSADALGVVVFNPVLGTRSELVSLELTDIKPNFTTTQTYRVVDDRGAAIISQQYGSTLHLPVELPSLGAQRYWIVPSGGTPPEPPKPQFVLDGDDRWILQNAHLHVEIDSQTGDIARCVDRRHQYNLLAATGGNRLEAYRDHGQYWDAWNIDPDYEQYPLAPPVLEQIEWLERGELRSRLRVTRRLNDSRFIQDYILDRDSPSLEVASIVDWRERHMLVKAAFDLAFTAERAVYETPCGAIERPIRRETDADRAQWEVPMLQWCDVSDNSRGLSLLNDCKYGGDATPDRLRLTLLRGSTWPDPKADVGEHRFRYALYPHGGTWQAAATVRQAIAFNQPPITLTTLTDKNTVSKLPLGSDWLTLGEESLVLMALKRSEAGDHWLLRCYESAGSAARLSIGGALRLEPDHAVDLLERHLDYPIEPNFEPWRVASFTISPRQPDDKQADD